MNIYFTTMNKLLFSLIRLKVFLYFSHLMSNEISNNLYIYMILRPLCVCIANCVFISVSKYLLNSIKLGPKIPQYNTSENFFIKYVWFLLYFYFPFFEVSKIIFMR